MANQFSLFTMKSIDPEEQKKSDSKIVEKSQTIKKQSLLFNVAPDMQTIQRNSQGITHNKIMLVIEAAKRLLSDSSADDFELIMDESRYLRYIEHCLDNKICALDTESCGLNPILHDIAGVCLFTEGEKASYVPINHINHSTLKPIQGQLSKEIVVKGLIKLREANTDIAFHNAKYDFRVLRNQLGIDDMPIYWDSLIAGNLLNENEPHSLKYLFEKYIHKNDKVEMKDLDTYDHLFDDIPFIYVPLDIGLRYAAKDPFMTMEVCNFQEKYLRPDSKKHSRVFWLWHMVEKPVISVTAKMEDEGIPLNKELATKLHDDYTAKLEDAKKAVYDEIDAYRDDIKEFGKKNPDKASKLDDPINLASTTQLAILFYDILNLESSDSTKPRGTGEEILEDMDHPIADKILKFREIAKLLSTYIDKLPKEVNPKTGRIHAKFNQYGAKTGRYSSDEPNLQNIPKHNKDVRPMFVAPDGYILLGGDYSQQEPRALAFASQDEHMLKAYRDGKDIYATIAAKVFKVKYEDCMEFYLDENGKKTSQVNKEGGKRRDKIKSIVLGIMYGRGAASIAKKLGIAKQEAQQVINDFYDAFPKVKKLIDDSQQKAREFGYVETIWGRKRRLPDMQLQRYEFKNDAPANVKQNFLNRLNSVYGREKAGILKEARDQGIYIKDNGGFIAQAERQCLNAIIQGSAADMTKKAMILIGNNAELKELGYRMVLPVHDELIGICPVENAMKCKEIVTRLMIEAPTDVIKEIPMKVDITMEYSWTAGDFKAS